MKYPTLYRVANYTTLEVKELFAHSSEEAKTAANYDPTDKIEVSEILTPEGYQITTLRHLKKGEYFNLVAARGKKPTPSRVYVRGEFNRSAHLYECCYFEDINHCRLIRGDQLVTIDMTF